ncbi:hypothetical protein HPB49_004243 [Dermacentor silvarum]|uniref:Uncharacterized protein n=1 Tax=Dermacentor silvarum TaxID=543639 RepID=A0ACB8CPU9_DERSI|nr:hypothetical protein HPB49_004243 [Dermacentor silvarum]
MMFRNFEEDRFFGGTSKCVSATQKTAVVRDSVRTSVGYGKTKVPRRLTFHSSAGYTMKNVAREQLLDEPTESFNLTGVYIDCENCHIVRHSYVDEVPDSSTPYDSPSEPELPDTTGVTSYLDFDAGNAPVSLTEPASAQPRHCSIDACRSRRAPLHLALLLALLPPTALQQGSTVSECANEQTVPTMLSDAEEALTTADKPATIRALSDRDAASVPITEQTNDSQPGEDMDEDSLPLAIDTDTIEDEAYNGAYWTVVRNKRRARSGLAP